MTFIQRKISARILSVLERGKSVLLLGPRQTGKTTLIKQLKADLYISLVKPRTRLAYERDPDRLTREVEALKQGEQLPLVIIDEIQKIPNLMDAVQDLIDSGIAKFILTGSSARKLRRQGSVNLLPGRVISLHMDPLVLAEIPQPLPAIEELLLYGSLPQIITAKNNAIREEDLDSYVTTYLEEEVRAEALVRNMGTFTQFLKLAGIESGNISNFQNISKEIGVSSPTISGYYQILVDCLIAERIEPLTHSLTRKRLIKSPKFILYDLGVRRLAAEEGVPLPEKYMGSLFEQWVGLELLHMLRLYPERSQLMFWRDADGVEVDWIVERHNEYIPIEVKWTENPHPGDAKHIKTFLHEYPNAKNGYVVSRANRKQKLADRIFAIPWQELPTIF
jgi:predicted AAA+ superfamily ATPase